MAFFNADLAADLVRGRGIGWWVPLEAHLLTFDRNMGFEQIGIFCTSQRDLHLIFVYLETTGNNVQDFLFNGFEHLRANLEAIMYQHYLQAFLRHFARCRLFAPY